MQIDLGNLEFLKEKDFKEKTYSVKAEYFQVAIKNLTPKTIKNVPAIFGSGNPPIVGDEVMSTRAPTKMKNEPKRIRPICFSIDLVLMVWLNAFQRHLTPQAPVQAFCASARMGSLRCSAS